MTEVYALWVIMILLCLLIKVIQLHDNEREQDTRIGTKLVLH